MKNLSIQVLEKRAKLKWKVIHKYGDIEVRRLPKKEWKNHNDSRGRIIIDGYEEFFFYQKNIGH